MPIFGIGRKNDVPSGTKIPVGPPTDSVLNMRQQGLSNNQIIQNLQRQGYKPDDIFEAMNQADIKGGVEAAPLDSFNAGDISNPMQPPSTMPPGPPSFGSQSQGLFTPPPPPSAPNSEKVEELVEAIIDEKWNDFVVNINKVIEWKNKMESRIGSIEQEIKDLKVEFEGLHNAVLGKISEYDKNIVNVGAELKAMEQVFQKVLPSLSENVNELSRITTNIKSQTKTAKSLQKDEDSDEVPMFSPKGKGAR